MFSNNNKDTIIYLVKYTTINSFHIDKIHIEIMGVIPNIILNFFAWFSFMDRL